MEEALSARSGHAGGRAGGASVLLGGLEASGRRLGDAWRWNAAWWRWERLPVQGGLEGRAGHVAGPDPDPSVLVTGFFFFLML